MPGLWWLLGAALAALPALESYTPGSLPRAVAGPLGELPPSEVLSTRRFRDADPAHPATLWVLTRSCGRPGRCPMLVILQEQGATRLVGQASETLVDATPQSGLPRTLVFHPPGETQELLLEWDGQRYLSRKGPRRYRDPLSQQRIDGATLREFALTDLKEGRAVASAGRYMILCAEDPCPALDLEALATAELQARLFPQAEAALRRALALPGHQAQDWQSLASLYRAQGRNSEASEAEARFARESSDGGG